MKKVILSTIAAAALTTSAMAEIKVGVGIDAMLGYTNPTAAGVANAAGQTGFATVLGSTPVIRIDIDGVVPGLRIEPRFAYINATNDNNTGVANTADEATLLVMGLGGYYDISKLLSVGAYYDMYTMTAGNSGTTSDTTASSMAVLLKAETEIAAGFTIASEIGYASTTTTPAGAGAKDITDLHPVTSITLRYFF